MYGRTFVFVENFHVNSLSVVLEIFHVFNFRGTRYPRKLFNLKHFPITVFFPIATNNDSLIKLTKLFPLNFLLNFSHTKICYL